MSFFEQSGQPQEFEEYAGQVGAGSRQYPSWTNIPSRCVSKPVLDFGVLEAIYSMAHASLTKQVGPTPTPATQLAALDVDRRVHLIGENILPHRNGEESYEKDRSGHHVLIRSFCFLYTVKLIGGLNVPNVSKTDASSTWRLRAARLLRNDGRCANKNHVCN